MGWFGAVAELHTQTGSEQRMGCPDLNRVLQSPSLRDLNRVYDGKVDEPNSTAGVL